VPANAQTTPRHRIYWRLDLLEAIVERPLFPTVETNRAPHIDACLAALKTAFAEMTDGEPN